jgi:hypothetical protein
MKHKRKAAVAAGLLAFLIGTSSFSQEVKPNIPKKDDVKIEMPFFATDLLLNFNGELPQNILDYSKITCFTSPDFYNLYSTIIGDITSGEISSYDDLLNSSSSLTENQKILLASAAANQLYGFAYDYDYNGIVKNKNIFFEDLQKAFNREKTSFGLCRHISSSIETMLNDMKITAASVEGSSEDSGHAFVIAKLNEGLAMIDSYEIFSTPSKNVEKLLEFYQKSKNALQFQHWFYNGGEFKYSFITKDGERFLKNIIDYDPSLNPTKDSLLNKPVFSNMEVKISKDNEFFSFLTSFFGSYLRIGMFGEELSLNNKTYTLQAGFKKQFTIPKIISITPDASLFFGDGGNYLLGTNYGLTLATDNEKGINASLKYSGGIVNKPDATLFTQNAFSGGISYTLPLTSLKIEPYLLSQFSFIPDNQGESYHHPVLKPNEFQAGLRLSFPIKNMALVFEPNYTNRPWENEFGAKLKVGTGIVNCNLEASVSKSGYEFCPDKLKIKSGIDVLINNLTIGAGYNAEGTNYEGERELTSSFYLNGKIMLK